MRQKEEFQYLFDGPVRFTRHFLPTVGLLTNSAITSDPSTSSSSNTNTNNDNTSGGGRRSSHRSRRDVRLYSTWKFASKAVPLFFRDVHQNWNTKYPAAQKIFGAGPTSLAVRSGIQAGHRMLYARLAGNGYGTIKIEADPEARAVATSTPPLLEAFVKQVPEAKLYYTLETAEDYKFKLPDPSLLEGVKTKEKSLIKMCKVSFQYSIAATQQLHDIALQVSLSSLVAVLSPNGSGRSTLVKLLIGDTEPNKGGEIWKHRNLVIGRIAQHAFHHIDQHLDKTALEYMLWRYQTGEDLEEMGMATRQISEEEQKKMKDASLIVIEG
ncbi:hypothetical protein MD484_g6517, partial [Candolleomyces efflorescens]